jgi:hypothetical protein
MSEINIGSRVRVNESYGTIEYMGHRIYGAEGSVAHLEAGVATVVMDNKALHVLNGYCLFKLEELDLL